MVIVTECGKIISQYSKLEALPTYKLWSMPPISLSSEADIYPKFFDPGASLDVPSITHISQITNQFHLIGFHAIVHKDTDLLL